MSESERERNDQHTSVYSAIHYIPVTSTMSCTYIVVHVPIHITLIHVHVHVATVLTGQSGSAIVGRKTTTYDNNCVHTLAPTHM